MRELSIQEIKQIELNIMKRFDSLCKKNGWRYSLAGGSLLGAVRHKGFIPWDDDMDVIMPRPDYDAMERYFAKNKRYHQLRIITHNLDHRYTNLFAKVIDVNTVIKDDNISLDGLRMGISIDVFPVEGLGGSKKEAIQIFKKTSFKRELLNACTWKRFFLSKTHSWYIEPIRFIMFIISRFCNANAIMDSIDKINRKKSFDSSVYAGSVCGCYRQREIMKKKYFIEYSDLPFEDSSFKCLSAYDEYLRSLYGEYMKLPPLEKRVTHHTFKAFIIK